MVSNVSKNELVKKRRRKSSTSRLDEGNELSKRKMHSKKVENPFPKDI